MQANELIGKKAIRSIATEETPIAYELTSRPVYIEKITDTHIICYGVPTLDDDKRMRNLSEKELEHYHQTVTKKYFLNSNYLDDNWVSYDSLTEGTSLDEQAYDKKRRNAEEEWVLKFFLAICVLMVFVISAGVTSLFIHSRDLRMYLSIGLSIAIPSVAYIVFKKKQKTKAIDEKEITMCEKKDKSLKHIRIMYCGEIYDTEQIVFQMKLKNDRYKGDFLCKDLRDRWLIYDEKTITPIHYNLAKDIVFNEDEKKYYEIFSKEERKEEWFECENIDLQQLCNWEPYLLNIGVTQVVITALWYGVQVFVYQGKEEYLKFQIVVCSYGDGCSDLKRKSFFDFTKAIAKFAKEQIERENRFWLFSESEKPFAIEMREECLPDTMDVEKTAERRKESENE